MSEGGDSVKKIVKTFKQLLIRFDQANSTKVIRKIAKRKKRNIARWRTMAEWYGRCAPRRTVYSSTASVMKMISMSLARSFSTDGDFMSESLSSPEM
eukprot:3095549-Pleurochrysis_carterae.AAC.1